MVTKAAMYMRTFRKRHKERLKEERENLKFSVMAIYSDGQPICVCCGETEIRFLTIDHINNNGANHRKERANRLGHRFYRWLKDNGFPDGYQVMCFNCNCGKFVNGGICPHKEKVSVS